MAYISRRRFLRSTTAASFALGAGGLSILNAANAHATDVTGYKALVCINLFGGMCGSTLLLPTDAPSFQKVAELRPEIYRLHGVGSGTSRRDRENLLRLDADMPDMANTTRRFGFDRGMQAVADMFNQGEASLVANVGPLIRPTNRDQFHNERSIRPPRLFSHNSQRSVWVTRDLEGRQAGWGGEFLRAAMDADPMIDARFAGMNASGAPSFLQNGTLKPLALPKGRIASQRLASRRYFLRGGGGSDTLQSIMASHLGADRMSAENVFERDLQEVYRQSEDRATAFNSAFDTAVMTDVEFPNTTIGERLARVTQALAMRDRLAGSRQIFHISVGGFDSHGGQVGVTDNLQEISEALGTFREALISMGLWDSVTTFTASEFGRTLRSNGPGTDHGWGSHHFVMGGAVRGGRIVGEVPEYDTTLGQYTSNSGRLIPTISVDQYAATLGRWFGLDSAALQTIFPNLENFATQDLGLFKAS